MGRLVAVIGPSGVGKTSLVQALIRSGGFAYGLEDHAGRPFQQLFDQDRSYALQNQVDYLLHRAREERALRAQPLPALVDGGLDQDFHAFTRLFHARGWLNPAEFELCARLYEFIRSVLPPPELVVALEAPPEMIRARLEGRDRINIAGAEDAGLVKAFLDEWTGSLPQEGVLRLDVSRDQSDYARPRKAVIDRLTSMN